MRHNMQRAVKYSGRIVGACVTALACRSAYAVIPTDPGDYVPLPPGTNLAVLYYQHSHGDHLYGHGDEVNLPFRLDTDIGVARYVRYLSAFGMLADVQAILPFGSVRMSEPASSVANGVGDPIVGTVLWVVNDPETRRYLALSAFLQIPIGSYNAQKGAVNVGSHRWSGIFHVTYGQQLIGKLGMDITGEYAIYGRNDDYMGLTYQQKPTYEIQTHLRYAVTPATTVGFSWFQTMGGRTTLGGADQNDRLNTGRYLLTVQQFLSPTLQLEGQFGQDVRVSNGPKEKYRINLRLVKVF